MKWIWAILGSLLIGAILAGAYLVTPKKLRKTGEAVISIGGHG